MNSTDVFISYGRADDKAFVDRLYTDLQKAGYGVWYDQSGSLHSNGLSFQENIRDGITQASRVLLVVGPHSVQSENVRLEWEFALDNCLVIIPILRLSDFDAIPLPLQKRKLHAYDFRPQQDYDVEFSKLLLSLSGAPLPLTDPPAGNLPQNLIPRSALVDSVLDALLKDSFETKVLVSMDKNTALVGMGGSGKSVIARLVCNDCTVRRTFQDGIHWLSIGLAPSQRLQQLLMTLLGDNDIDLRDRYDEARQKVQAFLTNKNCLIVLDDVWDQGDIKLFVQDRALRCRLLITTRNRPAVANFANQIIDIDVLSSDEARELLLQGVDKGKQHFTIDTLPKEANDIIAACGYLPLAIDMVAGMIVAGGDGEWRRLKKTLEGADLALIKKDDPEYPYHDLFHVLDISIAALPDERARSRYQSLAVFRNPRRIPLAMVHLLWDPSEPELATSQFLADLVGRSLLSRSGDDLYSLHDLQSDFLVMTTKDNLRRLHADLIRRLGDPMKISQSYAWKNYIWHLLKSGDTDTPLRLLASIDWLQKKITAAGIDDLLGDYEILPTRDEPTTAIYTILRRGRRVLTGHPSLLLSQLYEHLVRNETTKGIIAACENSHGMPWLKPILPRVRTGLEPETIYRLFRDRIVKTIVTETEIIVSTTSGTIYFWDKADRKEPSVLNAHEGPVNDMILMGEELVTGGADGWLKFWQLSDKSDREQANVGAPVWRMLIHRGRVITVSNDGFIRFWDREACEQAGKIGPLPGPIKQVEVYANSALYCRVANTLYCYDLRSSREKYRRSHLKSITCFAIIGDTVVSVSADHSLQVGNSRTGDVFLNLPVAQSNVLKTVVVCDRLFMASFTDPVLLVYDTKTFEITGYPLHTTEGIYDMLLYKQWMILSMWSKEIRLMDINDPTRWLKLFRMSEVSNNLVLDGDTLIAGNAAGMIYACNLLAMEACDVSPTPAMEAADTGKIIYLWTTSDQVIVTTHYGLLQCYQWGSGALNWSLQREVVYTLSKGYPATYQLILSEESVGTPDWDGNIQFWSVATGAFLYSTREFASSFEPIPDVFADYTDKGKSFVMMAIGVNQRIIAALSLSGVLRFWDLVLKKEAGRVEAPAFGGYPFVWEGRILFPNDKGTIAVIEANTYTIEGYLVGHRDYITAFAVYGDLVLSTAVDGYLKAWSVDSRKEVLSVAAHTATITDMLVYKDWVITCGRDKTIKVWDGWQLGLVCTVSETEDFQCLKVWGSRLVACASSGLIHVYDLEDSLKEITLFASDDFPWKMAISEKYGQVAFGGSEGGVKFLGWVGKA